MLTLSAIIQYDSLVIHSRGKSARAQSTSVITVMKGPAGEYKLTNTVQYIYCISKPSSHRSSAGQQTGASVGAEPQARAAVAPTRVVSRPYNTVARRAPRQGASMASSANSARIRRRISRAPTGSRSSRRYPSQIPAALPRAPAK